MSSVPSSQTGLAREEALFAGVFCAGLFLLAKGPSLLAIYRGVFRKMLPDLVLSHRGLTRTNA